MYLHDGASTGPRRRPKEEANLRNGDCSSHRFDGLGWRDCEKNLLVVDQTVEELEGSWKRYRRIRLPELLQKSWTEPMLGKRSMRSERMFLPLLIVQNRYFMDESCASSDNNQRPSCTMMYLHNGSPTGPRRCPKEEANLQNGDCSSHPLDGLGWHHEPPGLHA